MRLRSMRSAWQSDAVCTLKEQCTLKHAHPGVDSLALCLIWMAACLCAVICLQLGLCSLHCVRTTLHCASDCLLHSAQRS